MSGNELGYSMKAIVGSQRYGFVLLLSIWIVYKYSIKISKSALIVKYTIILILSSGILLTFSRSGIISLIASIVLYVLFNNLRTFKVFRKNNFKISVNTIVTIFMVIIILILFNIFLSAPLNFYWERLFELLLNMRFDALSLQSNLSSGGYRIFMITKILDFIFINPFTGSGYLGVWIMFDDLSGSAHSQYFDVLFRTGIFGFMIYIFLIYKIMKFLYFNDTGLFWGFIGILIYGLFHETFKLSQGGFLLTFVLGMMVQKNILYTHTSKRKYIKKY